MSRLYLLRDPWALNTPTEHQRFQETSRIIRGRIAEHFASILEVGCGEGLQTGYLAQLTDEIVGIDPSSLAIRRASARGIARASFATGNLMNYKPEEERTFDLVTACEVLYYMEDFQWAYERLNKLGRNCFVTYYQGAYQRLDGFFAKKDVHSEVIRSANCEWKVVYWRRA